MPHYDYECRQCGHTFEAFQKMSEAPLADCPSCGGKGTVLRLVGAGAGLIFKGSGFYITDYKNAGGDKKEKETSAKAESAKSESSKSEPAKSESTKTEAAPAATESKSTSSESSSASTCGNVAKSGD